MTNSIYSAAKCLTCGRMAAVGVRIMSAVQQSSTSLLRVGPTTTLGAAATRLFTSIASARPAISQSLQTAKNCEGNGSLTSQINTFSSPWTRSTPAHTSLLSCSTPTIMQTRGRAKIFYKPSAWKRVNKHGLEKRLTTPGGIEILWRRILKKRHSLTPFDRILPGTYNAKILPEHHLKYNQHLVRKDVLKKVKQAIRKK